MLKIAVIDDEPVFAEKMKNLALTYFLHTAHGCGRENLSAARRIFKQRPGRLGRGVSGCGDEGMRRH